MELITTLMSDFLSCFDEIYIMYFPRLYRFAKVYVISDEEAKNIVQDVFMTVWEKKEVINAQNISTYLFSLVKNRCIDFLRHEVTVRKNERELSANLLALDSIDLSEIENREKKIREAISVLPDKCRKIFILAKIQGKKHKEIASLLGISQSTIETQISIAMEKLRKIK